MKNLHRMVGAFVSVAVLLVTMNIHASAPASRRQADAPQQIGKARV